MGSRHYRIDGEDAFIVACDKHERETELALQRELAHEINIESVNRRSAEKLARSIAKQRGVDYVDCNVFVKLPERGRYLIKNSGYTQLCAGG